MSYNGYSQFSPYYQQPPPQQNGGSQHPYDPRLNGSYPSTPFQPLSAYDSDNERQQSTEKSIQSNKSSNTYGKQSYASTSVAPNDPSPAPYINHNYGGVRVSSSASQDSSIAYANSRPDTSALGNLAYVSSLNQDQPHTSLAQLIDYNRSRDARGATGEGYQTNSTSPVSHGHQRVESRGFPCTKNHQSSQAPSHSGSHMPAPGRTSRSSGNNSTSNTGKTSPAQHQNASAPQKSPQSQYGCYASQPAPAGGQATQRPSSRTSIHNQSSSQTSMAQRNQNAAQNNGAHNLGHPQASSVSYHRSSPAVNQTTFQTPKSVQQNGAHQNSSKSTPPQNEKIADAAVDGGKEPSSTTHYQIRRPASSNALNKEQSSQPSPSTANSKPITTVDPNQVFNHLEYQRRQSETEVAKKGAEAAKISNEPKPTQSTASTSTSPPADDVTQAAKALMGQSSNPNYGSPTKEQIELEMKQMIEKMRDYKAKDPKLFSQVWEDVKKGQSARRSPIPETGKKNIMSPTTESPNMSPAQTELPAESDLPIASSFPHGFDRGRYPMQRRRRGNASYTPEDRLKKKPEAKAPVRGDATQASGKPGNQEMRKASEPYKYTSELPAPKKAQSAGHKLQSGSFAIKGGTFWPEHKKRVLADAARVALTSSPSNVGKGITTNEIHALLDRNPSYSEMCGFLERKGFTIDRPVFARTLLAAVPDMNAPTNQQNTPAPPPIQTSEYTNLMPPYPHLDQDPIQDPNAHIAPYTPHPFQSPSSAVRQNSSKPTDKNRTGEAKQENQNGPPLAQTKEDKARKRNFEDIVDLTAALSDDDEFMRHRPKPRMDKPKGQIRDQVPTNVLSNNALKDRWKIRDPASAPRLPPKNYYKPSPKPFDREHLLYEMVVEPINKRRDALRRSSYDARTICRDILVASGKHPTMSPLNHHLDVLRDRFISVENNADLGTFRWDLVDPGGPPPPLAFHRTQETSKAANTNRDGPAADGDVISPLDQPESAMRVYVSGRSRSGIRPDSPTQTLESKTTPGETRRGGPPKRRFNVSGLSNNGSISTPSGADVSTSSPDTRPLPTVLPRSTPQLDMASSPDFSSSINHTLGGEPINTPIRVHGRKGRPPGAKNKHPRVDKGIAKRKSSDQQDQSPAKSSIPSEFNHQMSTPVRPSGLRNNVSPSSASGVAVVIHSRSPSIAEPTSALKSKGQDEAVGRYSSTSAYRTYKCLWANCPAELHSLDILRKHVRKQHRQRLDSGPWPCRWAGCSDSRNGGKQRSLDNEVDNVHLADAESRRLIFTSEESWDQHVESKHLNVYASQLADGPQSQAWKAQDRRNQGDNLDQGTDGGIRLYDTGSKVVSDAKKQALARSMSAEGEQVIAVPGKEAVGGPGALDGSSSDDDNSRR